MSISSIIRELQQLEKEENYSIGAATPASAIRKICDPNGRLYIPKSIKQEIGAVDEPLTFDMWIEHGDVILRPVK